MTWTEFVAAVREHLLVHNARLGIQTYINRQIINALRDIQLRSIFYRTGHEKTYHADDMTQQGEAGTGALPSDCYPTLLEVQKISDRCRAQPVYQYPQEHVRDLICGNVPARSQYYVTIDDFGKKLTLFPNLDEDHQLVLLWDGIRDQWDGAEQVPFDADVAQAVAAFVMAKIAEGGIDKTPQDHLNFTRSWLMERRKVIRNGMNRTRVRQSAPTPDGSACANVCDPCADASTTPSAEDEVEVVLFGDSGDPATLNDTVEVAGLLNVINPDLFIHLGDANYPAGAEASLQDNFTKHFYGWIPDKTLFAFGEVDLDSGALDGSSMTEVLPFLATINSGKKYYRYVLGPVEFFIMHGAPWEADGYAPGSVQQLWLAAALADSSADWKIVCNHRAYRTSDLEHTPGDSNLSWLGTGADMVIQADSHNYERLRINDKPWLICGLGGAPKECDYEFLEESQYFYCDKNGVLKLTASATKLQVALITVDGETIDQVDLTK